MLTFIVSNLAASPPSRCTATLAADASLVALHEKVAEECRLLPGTFELRLSNGVAFRLTDERAEERQLGLEAGIVRSRPRRSLALCHRTHRVRSARVSPTDEQVSPLALWGRRQRPGALWWVEQLDGGRGPRARRAVDLDARRTAADLRTAEPRREQQRPVL